jgi:NNP family nitrate/nitrite transporter-like MFS transporter
MASADMVAKMDEMEKEIKLLHDVMQARGVNSRGTCDIYGRKFTLPVDAEHKATEFNVFRDMWKFDNPHHRTFQTTWFGFFSSFFSMFAAAGLMAYMRDETSLNLTKKQIGTGNICAVSSNIIMRAVTGFLCDMVGPRRALACLLFVTCPPIIGIMFVPKFVDDPNTADAWIACRSFIGIGLATFVTSQVWCAQMFNKKVVGIVNATSAGWGNLGGGVTNLTMPLIFLGFYNGLGSEYTTDEKKDRAWRLCYIVPLLMHFCGACFALTARDLPDGNIKELEASGAKQKSKGSVVLKTGLSNVNAWILVITYGMCFGVELTMNSVAALYFYDYHGLTPQTAGLLASLYGLMNLFARSVGGWISDVSNKHYGMRGRLWSCWIVQTLEGVMCMFMAMTTLSMDSPHDKPKTMAYVQAEGEWYPLNGTMVPECGCKQMALPNGVSKTGEAWPCFPKEDGDASLYPITLEYYERGDFIAEAGDSGYMSMTKREMVWTAEYKSDCVGHNFRQAIASSAGLGKAYGDELFMAFEPPFNRGGDAEKCIQHQGAAGMSVLCMILFSLCVQAAEGLHYGIVPYVSRPALGIVSGMVGAGGNLGSVIALRSFFFEGDIRRDEGFLRLGAMVIGLTALMFFIYFPDMGSLLTPAGALGSYDPQLIKPPADYRGADHMDFSAVKDNKSKGEDVKAETQA